MRRRTFLRNGLWLLGAPSILRAQSFSDAGFIGGVGTASLAAGGGGGGFTDPTSISGMWFWYQPGATAVTAPYCYYDATNLCTNGQTIDHWVDKSGNGNQLNYGVGPYNYETGVQNSLPAVMVTAGATDMHRSTFANGTLNQPLTMFAVFKAKVDSDYHAITDGPDGTHRACIYIGTDNKLDITGGTTLTGPAVTNDTWYVAAVIFNGASSKIYLSKKTSPTTGDAGTNSLTGIYIGAFYSASFQYENYLGDLLLYSGALSESDIGNVLQWLGDRWNISIAA